MEHVGDLVVQAATAPTRQERVEAYGRLVQQFRDMACGYAYSIVGDFHLAEDVAQEAFLVAFGRLAQLREPEAFPAWLRRIVWSTCGRATRRKTVQVTELGAAEDIPSSSAEPAELAEQREMRDEVLKAIRELPAREREVTALFYIDGYSQRDIGDFLEVPVSTVKNRLNASRARLKGRMLKMVEETLRQNAPGERFNQEVIGRLLARPNLLEIAAHPVQRAWNAIRSELADYEIVKGGEVEDEETAKAFQDHAWENHAYRLNQGKALRFQMTSVTMSAISGRTPPVRLLAAGRVFRPDKEDAMHSKVFHQLDGVCIDKDAGVGAFKATCERAIRAGVPGLAVEWTSREYGLRFVAQGFEAVARVGGREYQLLGGGTLAPDALRRAGFDPDAVSGFAWGLSLDRLAMLRLGLEDIRKLWEPPFVR